MTSRSTLAPKFFPSIPAVHGVQMATGACGVRYSGKKDLLFVSLDKETEVAGVFTQSKTAAAPVDWCRQCLKNGKARALVVNSGNANAFTGREGIAAVERTALRASQIIGCAQEDVFIASTGVIGEVLPDYKITDSLGDLYKNLGSDWEASFCGINTSRSTYRIPQIIFPPRKFPLTFSAGSIFESRIFCEPGPPQS